MTRYLLLSLLCVGTAQAIPVIHIDGSRQATVLEPHNVHPLVRDLPCEKAEEVLPHLATQVKQNDRGEYVLYAYVRGVGGGPLLGSVAWGATWAAGLGTVGVLAFYEGPLALMHAPEILELTGTTAQAAFIVGTAAPTM